MPWPYRDLCNSLPVLCSFGQFLFSFGQFVSSFGQFSWAAGGCPKWSPTWPLETCNPHSRRGVFGQLLVQFLGQLSGQILSEGHKKLARKLVSQPQKGYSLLQRSGTPNGCLNRPSPSAAVEGAHGGEALVAGSLTINNY